MDTAQDRTCGNATLPTMALPSPRNAGQGLVSTGPGPQFPRGLPFTPTLHPYPPSTQSRNLGSCQKNTYFILFFIFLIKGLHIIVCLTKTKVLVSEFENYFPRINGKGSLINIF